MRERILQFMRGRYGTDQLNRFLTVVLFVLLIVEIFHTSAALSVVTGLLLVVIYFRMFSKNLAKRYHENQQFLTATAPIRNRVAKLTGQAYTAASRNAASRDKTHRIYRCPGCKQKIRVPKGKGKIEITCPKCKKAFIRRT